MDFAQFLQFLITGLTVGSIYALLAIGFVTIYNTTGILNFAQGEFAMIGAMSCISLIGFGLPMFAAIPIAILFTAFIGLFIERTLIKPARKSAPVTLVVITIGLSIFLKGLGLIIWGTYPKTLSPIVQIKPIHFFGAVINPQSLFIFAILIVLLALLYFFFDKTFIGSALRASETNPRAASLMGINTQAMSGLSFTLAAALGAIAGIIIAPLTDATYEMGFLIGLKGFVAMVIGGMNNISGAVMGGLVLGVVEAFSSGLLSSTYSDAISFTVLLLVLFFRPNGLFGKATGLRV
ncbi:branched-chain amino acid ABC transporter permease [Paenibacillus validus]|uniref:branched-chain amino acid ABC transporter permease n=2 Tax=Paenibacillus TaxID=44249 RepID=UPI000FDC8C73|nr:branched-chain amino acid ABC transporter permease [Paenibacillus validus]MED4601204.1 branched-chain amino acid ABC transporter permease [Paenibacillus validus]MED4606913.1 branched-chain amino acid ABC transporter permease [Paenibacillus validus]